MRCGTLILLPERTVMPRQLKIPRDKLRALSNEEVDGLAFTNHGPVSLLEVLNFGEPGKITLKLRVMLGLGDVIAT